MDYTTLLKRVFASGLLSRPDALAIRRDIASALGAETRRIPSVFSLLTEYLLREGPGHALADRGARQGRCNGFFLGKYKLLVPLSSAVGSRKFAAAEISSGEGGGT